MTMSNAIHSTAPDVHDLSVSPLDPPQTLRCQLPEAMDDRDRLP